MSKNKLTEYEEMIRACAHISVLISIPAGIAQAMITRNETQGLILMFGIFIISLPIYFYYEMKKGVDSE